MKIAYLGFDKTITKASAVLNQYFDSVDYFIYDNSEKTDPPSFEALPIMVENLLLPETEVLFTDEHRLVQKKIKSQYNKYKKAIYNHLKLKDKKIISSDVEKLTLRDFSEIVNIVYDQKQNVYNIENKNQAFYKYNYLIIQNNLFLIEDLQRRHKRILKKIPTHNFVGVRLIFSFKPKNSEEIMDQDFLLIDNADMMDIFDNWYIVRLSNNRITISFHIPYDQRFSENYIDFVIRRAENILRRKLSTLDIGSLIDQSLDFSDTLINQKTVKIYYPKNSCIFPSFTYWTQEKINYFVENYFVNKNRKNYNLFEKRGNIE